MAFPRLRSSVLWSCRLYVLAVVAFALCLAFRPDPDCPPDADMNSWGAFALVLGLGGAEALALSFLSRRDALRPAAQRTGLAGMVVFFVLPVAAVMLLLAQGVQPESDSWAGLACAWYFVLGSHVLWGAAVYAAQRWGRRG